MMHAISGRIRRYLETTRPFLIGDQWTRAGDTHTLDAIDPATGAAIGRFSEAQEADALRAVASARASFDDGRWRNLTPARRQQVLLRIADLIDSNAEALAELECLDGGKLFHAALAHEVPHAAETFRYYAGWCTKLHGRLFEPSVPGMAFHGYIRHEPVGVVAQIIPWNGALVAAAWKLAPALAAGCSIVLKPAELSTLPVLFLGELLLEAGVPPGTVNIITGRGAVVGQLLASHPDVNKVAFTGSTAVGKQLLVAAQGNLKRLSLELGGKSPTLIFADVDLDDAIAGAAGAIFSNAGQVCVAGSRVYAERSIYEDVCEGLNRVARRLKVGPGLSAESELGPLISAAHRGSVHEVLERSRAAGVSIIAGGGPLQ
ncbi:MAG: aldehyde dehydrogenase family protein, partial [Steroidobacteraceae bacterium]